jgi:hypothetical protein
LGNGELLSIEVARAGKVRPKVLYQMHHLDRENGKMDAKKVNPSDCLQCHRTAAISLVSKDPAAIVSFFGQSEGQAVLDHLNAKISEVAGGLPDGHDLAGFGPPMGPERSRSLEYLRRLSRKTSDITVGDEALERVGHEMNCVQCHDSLKNGPGNISAEFMVGDLFENYLLAGHMPPKTKLSAIDRRLLADLLKAEYYGGYPSASNPKLKEAGLFIDWLNKDCPWK